MTTATTTETVKEKAIELWKRSESWGDDAQIEALLITLSAVLGEHLTISLRNYKCVAMQMQEQGLKGEPYLHVRTFKGWRESGRMVKTGEKSTIQSVTWIGGDGDDGSKRMYPKGTHLFHWNQTDAIEGFVPSDEPATPREYVKREYVKRERKAKGVTAGLAVVQEGVLVSENAAKGGIEIRFSVRPSSDVLTKLKAKDFRWSSANTCWYRRFGVDVNANDASRVFAYSLQS